VRAVAGFGFRQPGCQQLANTLGRVVVVVEVAGIEPASFDAWPGLLRAQSALSLLDPIDLTNKSM
jgi:hypothetical protein